MLVKFSRPFWVLTIISTVGFLFFYIFQVNAEVSERYLIEEYEKKINELSEENKTLQIGSAQIVSLDKMAEQVASLNFEKTDKIHYIRVLEPQVVVK